ncbi:MAG: hypothetical protein ACE5ES_03030 [Candidatus Nanoarchaeia archaeon]
MACAAYLPRQEYTEEELKKITSLNLVGKSLLENSAGLTGCFYVLGDKTYSIIHVSHSAGLSKFGKANIGCISFHDDSVRGHPYPRGGIKGLINEVASSSDYEVSGFVPIPNFNGVISLNGPEQILRQMKQNGNIELISIGKIASIQDFHTTVYRNSDNKNNECK